jgi:hypothetical protein
MRVRIYASSKMRAIKNAAFRCLDKRRCEFANSLAQRRALSASSTKRYQKTAKKQLLAEKFGKKIWQKNCQKIS